MELQYNNKISKELATIYARLKDQYKNKYQSVFSAKYDKQDEDGQMIDQRMKLQKLKKSGFLF